MMYLSSFKLLLTHRLHAHVLPALAAVLVLMTLIPTAAHASELATGMLLIADEDKADPYFQNTVILVVHHRVSGSRGLVINRPTRFLLGELLFRYAGLPSSNAHVHYGGPEDTKQLRYLVSSVEPLHGASEIAESIWYGPGSTALPSGTAKIGGDRLRMFAGYVSWGPGQLGVEVRQGRWKLLPVRPQHIFRIKSDDLWPFLWRHTRKNDWVQVTEY